ncbi:MAG: M24 family metallopeptidase [Lachnospiraceae bacterium]|nr:M24 family metallopeptidase [Lachnospiraceae bacterium]
MLVNKDNIQYGEIKAPEVECSSKPIVLNDRTMEEHKGKIIAAMQKEKLDFLFIYADREHGGNFGYLTGFEPRFEEAVLVLHVNGKAYLLLGNENLKMVKYSRIEAEAVHVPHFSLPNQPMDTELNVEELIRRAEISDGQHGGVVGWKMFTSKKEVNIELFDVPYFLVDALKQIVGRNGSIENRTALFMDPSDGARAIVNADEAAHYEYGASNAAVHIKAVMDNLKEGKTEIELARFLNPSGQPLTVQTICASGQRFTKAVVAPRDKSIEMGEPFSVTIGLRGGLTCRAGYVARDEEDLPMDQKMYIEKVAKPYYAALATWYSSVAVGVTGGEIYRLVEQAAPKEEYGWYLNPGHLISSEEWLSSPFYKDSNIVLKSGMMLQMDIIFSVKGYAGINAEDGVLLADRDLRDAIARRYPELWVRMAKRRRYFTDVLGIQISDDLLPLSGLCGYVRPFLLDRKRAMFLKS